MPLTDEHRLLQLLREVVGDDDPRTYDTDEQWRESLSDTEGHPAGEFEHVEISVYAGTLRDILDIVRGPAWRLDGTGDNVIHFALRPQVVHLDQGKDVVCHAEADDLHFTTEFAKVTCAECRNVMQASACMDCGLPYAEFPLDVNLPRAQWLLVNPQEHGVLCARCIVTRAARVPGATVVHAVIEVAPPPPEVYRP